MKNILYNTLIVCMVAVMAFCGYNIYAEKHEEMKNQETIEEIVKKSNKNSDKENGFEPDWKEIKKINPDITAYLYYPELGISFPVVAAKDNSFYLNHDLNKGYTPYGSIFLDKKCDKFYQTQNNIIYGHSVLNGKGMFTDIEKLMDKNIFKKAGSFKLFTEERAYDCQVFSFQYINIQTEPYRISFTDYQDFSSWVENIKKNSKYINKNVEIDIQSKIVTLSTCADGGLNRYIIHAVMS